MKPSAPLVVASIGLAAFLFNPSFGCSSADDDYDYDGRDMEAAVVGSWRVTLPEGDTLLVLEAAPSPVALGQSLFAAAYACGSRSFYRSANACESSSSLALRGRINGDVDVSGTFWVGSLSFTQGSLDLQLSNGRRLSGEYLGRQLNEFEGTLWGDGGAALGRVTFSRVESSDSLR